MKRIACGVGVVAAGLTTAAYAQQAIDLGEETVSLSVTPYNGGNAGIDTQCGEFFYESGESYATNIGRTVGTSSRWEVYQPFVLNDAWELCSIGLDGWYVTGSPDTFNATIYPEDPSNPGLPDRGNPLIPGADFNLGGSGFIEWIDLEVDPLCLEPDVMYFVGAVAPSDSHWSAIYRDASLFGMNSMSYSNDSYCCSAPPIALRMRGNPGCGGIELVLTGDCPGTITATSSGNTPGANVAFVYAFGEGNQRIPMGFPCAGTELGLNATAVLAGTVRADGSGVAAYSGRVPAGACGRTFVQTVDIGSCGLSNVASL